MSTNFETGTFIAFKARTKFHLGSIQKDVNTGDIVHFDGTTAKIGGESHNLTQIAAAVRAGWLVPADAANASQPFQPVAAGVQVRSAQSSDAARGESKVAQMVHDEERDLGGVTQVRDRGDGKVMKVATEDASAEGVPVSRIKRPAQQKTVLTAENSSRIAQEIQKIDNTQGSAGQIAEPLIARATGDVQDARTGDTLSDILPEAVSSEVPAPGIAGEGQQPHLTQDEKAQRAAASAEAAKRARLAQVTPQESAAPDQEEAVDVLTLAGKVALIRAVIPNFEWDMTRHWKTRATDAVKQYGKNPLYLNGILSVETEAVKQHITEYLSTR